MADGLLILGNCVWNDADADGVRDGSEAGIAGVSLSLYADSNNDGLLDGGDALIATTTSGANGLYSFSGLAAGNYIVRVDASNFTAGGPLAGLANSPGSSDPDNNVDNDDNGVPGTAGAIVSGAITLVEDTEPFPGEGNNTNNTVDFGFLPANQEPAGTDSTISATEDAFRLFSAADLGFNDADGTFASVTFSAVSGGKIYVDADGTAGAGAPVEAVLPIVFTAQDLVDGKALFKPDANANGAGIGHVTFAVTDDDGATDASPNTLTIDVNAANDAPALSVTSPADGAEQIFMNILSGATVSDIDLDARNGGNGDYAGAVFSVNRNPASDPADDFQLVGGASFNVDGINLKTLGGQIFGHISADANGVFSISFTSLEAVATSALVDEVIQSVGYSYTGDNPPASVTLAVSFNDGSPGGGQGSGASGIDVELVTVNIAAADDGPLDGDATDNSITGTPDPDVFLVQQGGNDTVSGLASNDLFYFGAALTAADVVDGGSDYDTLALQGDYSSPLTLTGITSVEAITLVPGNNTLYGDPGTNYYDYSLISDDANVGAGETLTVDGAGLRAGEDLTFDGSAETDGAFRIFAGNGTDYLTGGGQDDIFVFGLNGQYGAGDTVDGGAGDDSFVLRGDYTIDFSGPGLPNALENIETIALISASDGQYGTGGSQFDYALTWDDDLLVAGQTITVDAGGLQADETVSFSGGSETDGRFELFGGAGSDVLTGGSGNDVLSGGLNADTLAGGAGADSFRYSSTAESTSAARDGIQDFTQGDVIDLSRIDADTNTSGDQAFSFIGNAAFSNTAGELRFESVAGPIWLVQGDTNGDGVSDFETIVVTTDADPITSADFVLTQGGPADAQDDEFATDELSLVNGNVFADNGSGADSGSPLVVTAVNGIAADVGTQIELPSGALLTLNADGTFTYDPNGQFEYTPTFASGATNTPSADVASYTVSGGDTATMVFTINGVDNNDTIVGSENADVLRGGTGNDLISAFEGDDLLVGGFGDDVIEGGDGFDRAGNYHVNEGLGGVTIDLNLQGSAQDTGSQGWDTLSGIEYVSGTPWADTLTGDANDNVLWGSAATIDPDSNWISTSNNDTLDGGEGNDLLYVGIGNHVLTGGDGIDTVGFTENWGDDPAITVDLRLQGAAQDTGQGLWTLSGIENLSGGDDGDTLTGDDGTNVLAGHAGNDSLSGGGGNDSLYGDGSFDTAAPSSGPPTLFTDIGANGNDVLEGGLGDDVIDGGGGSDTASYEHAAGGVEVFLYKNGGGNGESAGADGFDLLSGIENITGSAFNDQLGGNNLDNVIAGGDGHDGLRGNGGNDILLGGAGDDFLNGSAGDDIIDGGDGYDRAGFYEDATSAGVTVNLNLQGVAQDTGQGMDTLIGIENVSGSRYGDTLIGDDNDNWLWGSAATLNGIVATTNNDTLIGGGGNDLLIAGIGNHTLDGGDGIDTFRFSENGAPETGITLSLLLAGQAQASGNGSWTLTNIENLSGSTAGDNLTGDGNANVLAGDLGNDLLSGGAGDDTLYGDGQIGWDGHGTGGSGPITTFPDATGLYVGGVAGDDTLDGGAGNDQLYGGGGTDTASFASATSFVQASLYDEHYGEAFGADGYDQLFDIENLTGSAFSDLLFGNDSANVIIGGDGHDGLRGFGGNDTIYGEAGDDLLYGNAGDDYLDGGDGYDRVGYFSGATAGVTVDLRIQGTAQDTGQGMDTLVNIENATGTAFSDTLTGNDGSNWLGGQSDGAADTISGNGGDDLITDGFGDHVLDGGTGIDFYAFSSQVPTSGLHIDLTLQGAAQDTGAGNLTLSNFEGLAGSNANDVLIGDAGGNWLMGGYGDDTLLGGAGGDTLYGDGGIAPDTHGLGGSGPILITPDQVATFGGVSGNDLLEGGAGADWIDGGGGTDTASYEHASGSVTVTLNNNSTGNGGAIGADGSDTLRSIENVIGSGYADTITGSAAANVITGGAGNDFLQARGGDDTVYGGTGNDYLGGGTGNDYLDGGDGWDRASFSNGATGPVTVDLRIVGAQDTGLGIDTLVNIENVNATAFGDTLIGDDNANWLWGGTDELGVGDTIDGQGGDDLIEDGVGDHVLTGGDGVDTFLFNPFTVPTNATISLAVQGGVQDTGAGMMILNGFENLSGSSFSDTLIGDGFANLLAGSELGDVLIGGAGNDTLYGDGAVLTNDSPSGQITTYVDVATLGGVDGNDLLEGGLGNDVLNGGGGTDTASYEHASGGVNLDLGEGWANGADGNDTIAGIENAIGSNFNDNLGGDGGANVLEGRSGNDGIYGAAGDDTIYGGDGDDFLQGDFGDNNITAIGNDVIYGGNGNDSLRGGAGDDILIGGANNDLLRGNGGVDYFDGGADDGLGFNGIGDRVSFFELRATQGVVADLRTGIISNDGFGNVETMVGIESLGAGTAFADIFYGNDSANYLAADLGDQAFGFGGDDVFQVASAPAIVDGGTGVDRLSVFIASGLAPDSNGDGLAESTAAATAGFTINLTAGTLTDGYGNSGAVTGIENVDGTALGDTIIGDANANVLNGGNGNDVVEGRGGNDTLDGGNGADTASYANATGAVTVVLALGTASGADGSDTLANFENLIGGAFNDTLAGNGSANVIDGGDGIDTLAGFAGDDTLNGGAGSDNIYGHQGNDTLKGGDGNDNMRGGTGDDVIDGGTGFNLAGYAATPSDPIAGGVTVDLNLQGVGQNTGQGMDWLTNIQGLAGTQFADTLIGDGNTNLLIQAGEGTGAPGGDDQLFGNGGDDLLIVGSGNVLLNGGLGSDTVSFNGVGATLLNGVTVTLANPGAAQNTGSGNMTLTGIENLSGTGLADTLTGDGANNDLSGAGGNDVLIGGDGNDNLRGDAVFTAFSPTDGTLLVPYLATDATVFAGQVAGNDVLEGGLGNDLIDGGAGTDTASYANAGGAVTVTLTATGGSSSGADGADTLVSIENVTGGAFNDVLTGNNNANVIEGGDGHDRLSGAGGNDTLAGGNGDDSLTGGMGDDVIDGGAGYDRATFFGATTGVTVDLRLQNGAQNTGAGLDTLIGIEHLNGTQFADTLIGDAGDNWLWGFASSTVPGSVNNNDTIDGGDGNDLVWAGNGNQTLIGGNGVDTVMYNENFSSDVAVTISLALQGSSQATGQGNWTLTGFENLIGGTANDTLTGDGANNVIGGGAGTDTLIGGAGNDILWGDGEITFDNHGGNYSGPIINVPDAVAVFGGVSGNDVLEGGIGDDTIDGGGGADTARYANASGAVTVTLTASGGSSSGADGNDTLVSIENVTGGAFGDVLTGNGAVNVLAGGGGNDVLEGAGGNDTIDGGTGTDTASYANASAAVTVTLTAGGGSSSGADGADTLVSIENVTGGAFNDVLTGNGSVNVLTGGDGNDTLEGGLGNDTLNGGAGTDTASYANATAGVTVTLTAAGGSSSGADGADTLSNIENATGSGFNDTLNGNALVNVLSGGGGVDNVNGGDGDDFLYGGAGNDMLKGDKDNDTLYGGTGNDTLVGGQGNDRYVIEASSGADTISGFAHLVDTIVFDPTSGVTTFSQLTLTKVGGTNTLVSWGNGNSITISGLKPTDLSSADFSFGSVAAFKETAPTMRVLPTDSSTSVDTTSGDPALNWHAPAHDHLMF